MAGVDSGIVVLVFFDTGFVSILCGVFAGVVKSGLVYVGLRFWIVDSSARINRHMIGMVLIICFRIMFFRLHVFLITLYWF